MLDCDGVRLAVSREGHGPVVVCLHAIGHGGRDFDAFAAVAADRFEVIRIDWPGQGRSGPDARPASAERYAQLLECALDRLGVSEPVLLGNSIGGAAAILVASRRPVRALVLCDSGGLVPVSLAVRAFAAAFARFFRAGERGACWFERAFALYYRFLVLPSPAARLQRERIIRSAREIAPLLAAGWESFGRPGADVRDLAAGLEVPIWLAWAKSDRVIPLWMCRPAIRRMKNASVTVFRGGHAAFLEQPGEFAAAFMRFAEDRGLLAR